MDQCQRLAGPHLRTDRQQPGIHAANSSPETYAEALKAAYPSYYGGPWVDFSSLLLYGVINP
jgi:hypothetical protein